MVDVYKGSMTFSLVGGEVAQAGFWCHPIPALSVDYDLIRQSMQLRGDAFWTAIKDNYTDGVYYTGTTVSRVTVGVGQQESWTDPTFTPVPGSLFGNMLPTECAPVVSVRAGNTASKRGRFYLPPPSVTVVNTSGRLTSAFCSDVATAAVDLFDTGEYSRGVVYSRSTSSYSVVTSVDVGDVVDAQRRRRNRLTESRTSEPVS